MCLSTPKVKTPKPLAPTAPGMGAATDIRFGERREQTEERGTVDAQETGVSSIRSQLAGKPAGLPTIGSAVAALAGRGRVPAPAAPTGPAITRATPTVNRAGTQTSYTARGVMETETGHRTRTPTTVARAPRIGDVVRGSKGKPNRYVTRVQERETGQVRVTGTSAKKPVKRKQRRMGSER